MVAAIVTLHEGLRPLHPEVRVESRRPGVVHVAHRGVSDLPGQARFPEQGLRDAFGNPQLKHVPRVLDYLPRERVPRDHLLEYGHETLEGGVGHRLRVSLSLLPLCFWLKTISSAKQDWLNWMKSNVVALLKIFFSFSRALEPPEPKNLDGATQAQAPFRPQAIS